MLEALRLMHLCYRCHSISGGNQHHLVVLASLVMHRHTHRRAQSSLSYRIC
jgi:hypothetical protein